MNLTIAFLAVLGCLVLTIVLLQWFLSARSKLEAQLRQDLGEYQLRVSEYQKRLSMIDPYASDYMNSLSAESSSALIQIRRLISSHQRLIQELHAVLLSGDTERFPDALALLQKLLARPSEAPLTSGATSADRARNYQLVDTGDEIVPTIPKNWELQAEALLQQVGQDVYHASLKAQEIGLPRNRKRKPTIQSLWSAGIVRIKGKLRSTSDPNNFD